MSFPASVCTSLASFTLGLSLALGGCGGGGGASAERGTGTGRADWARVAAARCEEYQQQARKVQEKWAARDLSMAKLIEGSLRDGEPLGRSLISDLRALDVSEDARRDWTAFVDGFQLVFDAAPGFVDEQIAGIETDEMSELFTRAGDKMLPVIDKYEVGACSNLGAE